MKQNNVNEACKMESRKLTEKQTNVILMNQPVRFWS